jgi:hypothetical protein
MLLEKFGSNKLGCERRILPDKQVGVLYLSVKFKGVVLLPHKIVAIIKIARIFIF